MSMPRSLISPHGKQTPFLVWLGAVILAILATAVIITGVAVFIVYMIYKPQMPYFELSYAHLDKLEYQQSGQLDTQLNIILDANNDNTKADASFSDISFMLRFEDVKVAALRANPFKVAKNSSFPLNYVIPSASIPLGEEEMSNMDDALKKYRVPFVIEGQARTRWRVGIFMSVKFWTHLSCKLLFTWPNGTSVGPSCNSKSH